MDLTMSRGVTCLEKVLISLSPLLSLSLSLSLLSLSQGLVLEAWE
jgi:hypothetical protein